MQQSYHGQQNRYSPQVVLGEFIVVSSDSFWLRPELMNVTVKALRRTPKSLQPLEVAAFSFGGIT